MSGLSIRILEPEELHLAFTAACELREGRPQVQSVGQFTAWLVTHQYPQGYRIVAAFRPDVEAAVAFAGFRVQHALAWGRYLYVDDLITMAAYRGQGVADALFDWLVAESQRLACEQLHLDSGVHRHVAHRFYLKHGMDITSHHFQRSLL